MITLSKRLQAIADLTDRSETVADVGCDHGFLAIRLVEEGKAERVFATDIRSGPLEAAKEHILAHRLEDRIDTIQCDGLQGIPHADTIVIAGMGGKTMLSILEAEPERAREARRLILQPQSEIPLFRRKLAGMGFLIDAEDLVEEDGKYYPIMRAVQGEMTLTDTEAAFGPLLLQNRHPVLHRYLLWQKEINIGLHNDLSAQESERSRTRILEIKRELDLIDEALGLFGP